MPTGRRFSKSDQATLAALCILFESSTELVVSGQSVWSVVTQAGTAATQLNAVSDLKTELLPSLDSQLHPAPLHQLLD